MGGGGRGGLLAVQEVGFDFEGEPGGGGVGGGDGGGDGYGGGYGGGDGIGYGYGGGFAH